MSSPPPSPTALLITIRFSASIPDLPLSIPSPSKTASIFLKHRIRSSLPQSSPAKKNRLRLIYRGKILPDTAILSTFLKLPPPPPRRQYEVDVKGKGKGKLVEPEPELEPTRVYINCSIGDVLSAAELEAEAEAALASLTTTTNKNEEDNNDKQSGNNHAETTSSNNTITSDSDPQNPTTTTPAPRGFDRLLTTGFTPTEISQLRLQFLAIQSNIHTPETMPSPSTLRSMEDAWMDNASINNNNNNTELGGGSVFEDLDGMPGALDDLLWGNVMGFLWPLGAVLAVREEGVWSRRRGVAVVGGAVISVMFGLMRVLS